jgi:hypothetical protein
MEQEYLSFLKENQPLPKDSELTEELIATYNEARKYFSKNYNKDCVPLFLNSFGGSNGLGVYQLIEDTIEVYPAKIVLPIIKQNISSSIKPITYWNMQIASNFPDSSLIEPLKLKLMSDDFDLRSSALIAIGQIKNTIVRKIIEEFIKNEKEEELIEIATDILENQ